MNPRRYFSGISLSLLILALAGVFAWLTHWQIFEYDVFWLDRAGEEILATGRVQRIDTWSHTVFGKPWLNYCWLSSVALHLAKKLAGGYLGVIRMRSLLVGVWFVGAMVLVRRCQRRRETILPAAGAILLLAPWLYLMNWLRFQMRPDLFGNLFFLASLLLWTSGLQDRTKRIAGLGILLVWTNFHVGTVPFGIFLYCAAVLLPDAARGIDKLKGLAPWCFAAALAWFMNPYGLGVLGFVRSVLGITNNPDQQPFSAEMLSYSGGGWAYSLWLAYFLFSLMTLVYHLDDFRVFPGIFRSRLFVILAGAVYTLLFLAKIRTIPYMTLFFLPVAATGLSELLEYAHARWRAYGLVPAAWIILFFWAYAVPDHKNNIAVPIGTRISEQWLPIRSAEFIRRVRPQGKLFNFFNFGSYLVGELREYPVSIDGRETPFLEYEAQTKQAARYPESYSDYLRQRGINVVMEAPPEGELARLHALYYPKSEWAPVFRDFVSVVYLRRVPQHAEAIAKYEMK